MEDPGEECDDGDTDDNDACLSDCTSATCGDAVVWDVDCIVENSATEFQICADNAVQGDGEPCESYTCPLNVNYSNTTGAQVETPAPTMVLPVSDMCVTSSPSSSL